MFRITLTRMLTSGFAKEENDEDLLNVWNMGVCFSSVPIPFSLVRLTYLKAYFLPSVKLLANISDF